jgi:hypothetical protein
MAHTQRFIQTTHGTVCRHCLLWPDMCTCSNTSAVRIMLKALAGVMVDKARKAPR